MFDKKHIKETLIERLSADDILDELIEAFYNKENPKFSAFIDEVMYDVQKEDEFLSNDEYNEFYDRLQGIKENL